jgi:hypothetical protein
MEPEYVKVEDSVFDVHFLAQFPSSGIFLNRVGNIGLIGLIVGFEQGKEICAGNVEAFQWIKLKMALSSYRKGMRATTAPPASYTTSTVRSPRARLLQTHLQLFPIGGTIL